MVAHEAIATCLSFYAIQSSLCAIKTQADPWLCMFWCTACCPSAASIQQLVAGGNTVCVPMSGVMCLAVLSPVLAHDPLNPWPHTSWCIQQAFSSGAQWTAIQLPPATTS